MFSSSQFIHDKLGIKSKIDSSKVLSKPVNGYATPDTSSDKGYSKSSSTSDISETREEDDDGLPNEEDGTVFYADGDSTKTSSTKESDKSTTKKSDTPDKKSDKKSDTSDNKSENHYYY